MANEGGIPSTEPTMALAIQAAKGTAATANFITGLFTTTSLYPEFDIPTKTPEHALSTGSNRPTALKSRNRRTSYLGNGRIDMALYSRALPIMLAGCGFSITTAGAGPDYTHTCVIDTATNHKWLTVLHQIGAKELRATDARFTTLEIGGDPDGIVVGGDMQSLTIDNSLGTETGQDEKPIELLPPTGTIVLNVDPDGDDVQIALSGGDPASLTEALTIENPLDTETRRIHQPTRADLPSTGINVTFAGGGYDIDWDTYNRIVNGAVAGTEPSLDTALASLNYSYESAADIAGGGGPYGIDVTMPYVEIDMDPSCFNATGDEIIRWTFNCTMLDDVDLLVAQAPITIVVTNDVATY